MLRCQGIEVKNYDFTLGRLAYEILLAVQGPGYDFSGFILLRHVVFLNMAVPS